MYMGVFGRCGLCSGTRLKNLEGGYPVKEGCETALQITGI